MPMAPLQKLKAPGHQALVVDHTTLGCWARRYVPELERGRGAWAAAAGVVRGAWMVEWKCWLIEIVWPRRTESPEVENVMSGYHRVSGPSSRFKSGNVFLSSSTTSFEM